MWHDLLSGSLLGLKSFRTLVLRALADKTQVGTVEVDDEGTVTVVQGSSKTVEKGNSTSQSVISVKHVFVPARKSRQARAIGDAPAEEPTWSARTSQEARRHPPVPEAVAAGEARPGHRQLAWPT